MKTAKWPKKVMVIGLDAAIAHRVYDYAKEGGLPVIKKLIENGVYATNCLVPFPTITPPNWTTIVTGAWPGTHGITDFDVHIPGDPLDEHHQGFDPSDCQAEYVWTAAEREGKKTILVNYPTGWPPTLKEGIQIGGGGIHINEWQVGIPKPGSGGEMGPEERTTARRIGAGYKCTLADAQLFTTDFYPQCSMIEWQKASGWTNLPGNSEALEARLDLVYTNAAFRMKGESWHLLVRETKGEGYDEILLSKSKDPASAFAILRVGEWSPIITDVFETERGDKKASFRCKLLELSPDAEQFRLYVTALCAHDGWAYPASVTSEIKSKEGLPLPRSLFRAYLLEWVDLETLFEELEFQLIWMSDAAAYLLDNKEWNLYFMHIHTPDTFYHLFSRKIDPSINKDREDRQRYQDVELKMYQSIDRMIGRLTSVVDDDETLVLIVNDHGAKPKGPHFEIQQLLVEAGLTTYPPMPEVDPSEVVWTPAMHPRPDWSKTKALAQRAVHIYVNVKGRDPDGIVEMGEEYEQVRDEIIRSLYEYTDPQTGKKPVTLALRREDARVLGLHGDRVGDVVYAVHPDFGAEHGQALPTAERGIGSLKGLLIMAGPGVKKNYILERTVSLTDIVPTICHLCDLPIPKHAEGGIIYQVLEDPDAKLKELKGLRRNYTRLMNYYNRERALTHSYNEPRVVEDE